MASGSSEEAFDRAATRLTQSGVLGARGRLRELFEYLAQRGPHALPASQAELAHDVFSIDAASGDDATVRVYVHRLRKRLEQFYSDPANCDDAGRLVLPSGIYALRLEPESAGTPRGSDRRAARKIIRMLAFALFAALVIAGAGLIYKGAAPRHDSNPVWRPFVESERPIVIAVGDYYIFGERASDYPEVDRLVRDFAINSATDLARAQQADPSKFGRTEDMGLNYLPFSTAYVLSELTPLLSANEHEILVVPASELTSDTFRTANVVYVGLISGMGLLEDVNFTGSGFAVGRNYDELIELDSGKGYVSEEALSLASPRYYRDYGYFASFREPGGAHVAIIAGARDTGLRGLAPLVASGETAAELASLASQANGHGFEALYEITGQQGADLDTRLVSARSRP